MSFHRRRVPVFPLLITLLAFAFLPMSLQAEPVIDDAENLLASGDIDGALELLKGVPAEEQDSPYHTLLGQAYIAKLQTVSFMEKGPFAREALENFQKAIEIDPSNVEARANLGGYYLNAPPIAGGSTELALEQAQEIVKYDAVLGNNMLALIYVKEGQSEEAMVAYEEILVIDPENRSALYGIGKTAALSGENLERGKECLELYLGKEVLEGYPGYDGAHWRMGMILEHEGDAAGARAEYEEAIRLNPDSEQYQASLEALDAQ